MEIIITELSRYIIVFCMALYTYWGFAAFTGRKKKRTKVLKRQRKVMYLFHFLGYVVLYLNSGDEMLLGLYGVEVIFLFVSNIFYKRIYKKGNQPIINHMHMLFVISMVVLTRLNKDNAEKQFAYVIAGMVLCLVLPWILEHYKKLESEGWFYAVLGLILLLIVLLFGSAKYGAKNWLTLGPVALQPSEFVKILFVFAFASILSQQNLEMQNIVKITAMAAAYVMVLVLEKDLGAALIFFITYLFMLYVATQQAKYLLAGVGSGSVAAVIGYFLFSHVRNRVVAWKDPWATIDKQGYQVAQSLFAIGTGGWFGMGLMQGLPNSVPIRESDFIFSVISEELGAFFAISLILVYVSCFIWFVNISMKIKNVFFKLVAFGFSVMLMFQTFLTLGGATKFIPSTGVTLPLVSYGGSSVVSVIIMFCVIQSIYMLDSKEVNENVGNKEEQEEG